MAQAIEPKLPELKNRLAVIDDLGAHRRCWGGTRRRICRRAAPRRGVDRLPR